MKGEINQHLTPDQGLLPPATPHGTFWVEIGNQPSLIGAVTATPSLCPCGSQRDAADCCEPFIAGSAWPETAEALMRSRYTAYRCGAVDYLLKTWHPRNVTPGLREELEQLCRGVRWLSLEVLATRQGRATDKKGTVQFRVTYLDEGKRHAHQESARFARHHGRWIYLDGVIDG